MDTKEPCVMRIYCTLWFEDAWFSRPIRFLILNGHLYFEVLRCGVCIDMDMGMGVKKTCVSKRLDYTCIHM